MPSSLLLEGILAEDPEAARAQVWAFDHATVAGEASRRYSQLTTWISKELPYLGQLTEWLPGTSRDSAPADPVRHARVDELILPIEPDHWRLAKLGRIMSHLGLRFAGRPSEGELLDLCLEAEARSVALLEKAAGPDHVKKGIQPFTGDSVADLSRYVLRRLFEDLDANFANRPATEQERIAADIARRLAELPPEIRERIRIEAGVSDLSADALKRTGVIAAVGGALVGSVGVAGFAAYTTLSSVIAGAAGFVGLTLPFAVYIHASAALAFLSNPLLLAAATVVGGRFAITRANKLMRDRLVPMMVATAVMASMTGVQGCDRGWAVAELISYSAQFASADRQLSNQISNTFPCLPTV